MLERLQGASQNLLSTTASGWVASPADELAEGETQVEEFLADFGSAEWPEDNPTGGVITPVEFPEAESDVESFATIDLVEASNDVDLEDEAPVSGFVVAVTTSKLRRLHFVGNCGKIPGIHFRTYETFRDEVPDATQYDRRCRSCFPEYFRDQPCEIDGYASSGSSTHSSE